MTSVASVELVVPTPASACDVDDSAPACDGDDCAICLEQLKQPQTLPCGHRFCRGCLEGVRKHGGAEHGAVCPLCRGAISGEHPRAPLRPALAAPRAPGASRRRRRRDLLCALVLSWGVGVASWFQPILLVTLPPNVRLEPDVRAILYFTERCWNKATVDVHIYDGYGQQTAQFHGCQPFELGGKGQLAMILLLGGASVLGLTIGASLFVWRRHCITSVALLCGVLFGVAAALLALHTADQRGLHGDGWAFDNGRAVVTLAVGSVATLVSALATERLG